MKEKLKILIKMFCNLKMKFYNLKIRFHDLKLKLIYWAEGLLFKYPGKGVLPMANAIQNTNRF